MKAREMTGDQLRHMALRCPIKLKKTAGMVPADSGDFFAVVAKSEPMKRYWKAAKKDLLDRQMAGRSYEGDVGRVVIGGRKFSLFPKSGMLVREDFEVWCDANWRTALKLDGSEKESTKPLRQEDVKVDELMHVWKDIRGRALKIDDFDLLMKPEEWNTEWSMKKTLSQYSLQIAADEKRGRHYAVQKIQADLLAGLIAYKVRNYADAIGFFKDLAATALKTAKWIGDRHAKAEDGKREGGEKKRGEG